MYNDLSNSLKLTVDFMIQILVKQMCNISLHGWKENATYEFQNRKSQKFKDGI